MRRPSTPACLFALLSTCSLFVALDARAQDDAPPRIAVEIDPAVADPTALARELERDLGVVVALDAPSDAEAVLRVRMTETGVVRLELVREGAAVVREVQPPSDTSERVVSLALIAANLVRDQSTAILALLRVERVPAPAPEEPTPPVVVVGPPAGASGGVEPPAIEAPIVEPPVVEEGAAPVEEVPAAIDFAPMVGFSSAFQGRERRFFSLGVVGSLMGELFGGSIAGAVDLVLGDATGLSIAGAVSVGGRWRGVQIAGALSLSLGDVEGLQIASLDVALGDLRGLQIGAVAISGGQVEGAQIAAVNVAGSRMAGLQIAAVNVAGAQATGLQIAAVNVVGGPMVGTQIAAVNVAGGDVEGVQIGAVNVSGGRVRGFQLGVVNIAEDADASIGLVNVYSRGRTQLRVGADSGGLLSASLVHGARFTHSIVSVSTQPFQARPAALLGLGFGARIPFDDSVHLDFDALGHVVLDQRVGNFGPSTLVEARVVLGARVFDVLGLYAGLGYQVLIEPTHEAGGLGGPFGLTTFSATTRGWPVIHGGIQLF